MVSTVVPDSVGMTASLISEFFFEFAFHHFSGLHLQSGLC